MSCPFYGNNHSELRKRIALFLNTKQIDSMTLEQFKNQVKSLLELEVPNVYLALGTIASLENDIDNVHYYYQQAIERFSRKAKILANYADSLARLGHFSTATNLMLEAYYLLPGGIDYLDDAIHLCGITGRFHLLSELLRIKTQVTYSFQILVNKIVQLMDETQVTDEELEQLINITLKVLHRYDITVNPGKIRFSMEEDSQYKWFRYTIYTDKVPIKQIVPLISDIFCELRYAGISYNARTYFLPMVDSSHQ